MGSYNFTTVTGDAEDGGELLLGGLAKFTRYTVVAQAFNEVGAGPMTEAVTAQTLEDGEWNIFKLFANALTYQNSKKNSRS